MAPRGKKRFRGRNRPPMWLPLPRPCLQSLNMPGHPYYLPLTPALYLPPWTIPPSYFPKPICQCANENVCTTSNSFQQIQQQQHKNSTDCFQLPPIFCPYVETSESQQSGRQQNNDQGISSNSDITICSTCGAPISKLRVSDKESNFQDNQPNPYLTKDSETQSHHQSFKDEDSERKNTPITNSRKRRTSKYNGSCLQASRNICKTDIGVGTMSNSVKEMPYDSENANKSRKKSKDECSACKDPDKHSSRHQFYTSIESSKLPEDVISNTEGNKASRTSSSKLTAAISKKNLNNIASISHSNVKQSSCQCKFPPAYEHLSCTGNKNNSCVCTNDI